MPPKRRRADQAVEDQAGPEEQEDQRNDLEPAGQEIDAPGDRREDMRSLARR